MGIVIREYQTEDVTAAITIWNQVVEDGVAIPQEENLTEETCSAVNTSARNWFLTALHRRR